MGYHQDKLSELETENQEMFDVVDRTVKRLKRELEILEGLDGNETSFSTKVFISSLKMTIENLEGLI